MRVGALCRLGLVVWVGVALVLGAGPASAGLVDRDLEHGYYRMETDGGLGLRDPGSSATCEKKGHWPPADWRIRVGDGLLRGQFGPPPR